MGLLVGTAASALEVPLAIGEWAPYTGEKLRGNGLAAEIVLAAFAAAELSARVEFLPWKRAEAAVAAGKYFATFPHRQLDERNDRFLFSDPIIESRFVVAYRKNAPGLRDFSFSGPESFAPYRVGITAGTDAVGTPLRKAGAHVEETQNLDLSIRKLMAGRLDFVVDDQFVVLHSLKSLYPGDWQDRIVLADTPFGAVEHFRLMASRTFPEDGELLRRFNEGLARIRADGTYRRIASRYGR